MKAPISDSELSTLPPVESHADKAGQSLNPAQLIKVQSLRVSFAGKEVVHGIDFSMAPGERLALFDGLSDREWQAEVSAMGRSAVAVRAYTWAP